MNHLISEPWNLIQIGMIMGGVVALGALLVWLAGLMLALRGSTPKDRPQILRAYAVCRLPVRQVRLDMQVERLRDRPSPELPPAGQ